MVVVQSHLLIDMLSNCEKTFAQGGSDQWIDGCLTFYDGGDRALIWIDNKM